MSSNFYFDNDRPFLLCSIRTVFLRVICHCSLIVGKLAFNFFNIECDRDEKFLLVCVGTFLHNYSGNPFYCIRKTFFSRRRVAGQKWQVCRNSLPYSDEFSHRWALNRKYFLNAAGIRAFKKIYQLLYL